MRQRFLKIYNRRAHLHHYTGHGADNELFQSALGVLDGLIADYSHVDTTLQPPLSSQSEPYDGGEDSYSPWVKEMCEGRESDYDGLQSWTPPRPLI